LRGGAFLNYPVWLRCAYRYYFRPDGRDGDRLGFRVVVSPFLSER
jgi:formylglycine-generating enzyme required for sulfatase activity